MTRLCLVAVVHLPPEGPGQTGLQEDPQRPEAGLLGPLPGPLAHGLQGV